jgi:hypothetical protein
MKCPFCCNEIDEKNILFRCDGYKHKGQNADLAPKLGKSRNPNSLSNQFVLNDGSDDNISSNYNENDGSVMLLNDITINDEGNDPNAWWCKPDVDEVMVKNWGVTSPVGRIIRPTEEVRQKFNSHNVFNSEVECPKCHYVSTTQICPICHHDLSETTLHDDVFVLSIIGVKNAGKTTYLSALLDKLFIKKELGKEILIDFEAANEATLSKATAEYLEPTYIDNTVPDATRSVSVSKEIKEPLIYTMRVLKKSLFGRKKISKVLTFAFFDVAGEDLTSKDFLTKDLSHILKSDAYIFIIDPLQISNIAIDLDIPPPPEGNNLKFLGFLDRLTSNIKAKNKISDKNLITKPVAVTLSKMDKLAPLLHNLNNIRESHTHNQGFDKYDFKIVNDEVKHIFSYYNLGGLCETFTARFSDVAFFGVSALGADPTFVESKQKVENINPHRLEDPFLWLLYKSNLLKYYS